MNKQEVVNQLRESLLKMVDNIENENGFNKGYRYATQHCFDIINQIDEPEKPIVPQFVADWYEENKNDFEYNLYRLCIDFHKRKLHKDLHKWFDNDKNKPIQTLVNMHQFGYEVKKEKLYTARLKVSGEYLNSEKANKRYMMGSTNKNLVKELKSYCYTQAELKELNIWDNPAFEVEEVEEND